MSNELGSLPDRYRWTADWQKTHLVPLLRRPEAWNKVEEYYRTLRFLDEIEGITGLDETKKVLDVGCGITTVLRFIGGKRVGVDPLADIYSKMLPYPRDIYVEKGFGETLEYRSSSFDMVFCTNCIDHVDSPSNVIDEIKRVLRPNQYFVLSCETYPEDIGFRNEGHPHTFTLEKLEDLLDEWEILSIWSSQWQGIYRFLTDEPPTDRMEYIFLCRKE